MDTKQLHTMASEGIGIRKVCNLIDVSCQTDPVIILPMPAEDTAVATSATTTTEPPLPSVSLSTSSKPITPIYKSRNRRKKTPMKLNCQELQSYDQESEDNDADCLYIPKSQISATVKEPYYNPTYNAQSMANEKQSITPSQSDIYQPHRSSHEISNGYPSANRPLKVESSISKQTVSVIKSVEDDSGRGGRFKCLLCPYANNHKIALELHSIIHDSQPPYACRKCAFSSSDVVAFNVHVRHHTGEQKFTCYHPGCDYTSNNSSNLKRHCRSHKQSKPFRKSSTRKPSASVILSDDSSSDAASAPVHSTNGSTSVSTSVLNIPNPQLAAKPAHTVLNQLADVVNGISSKGLPNIAREIRSQRSSSNVLQCEQCEYHTTNPTNLRRHKVKHRLHRSHKCTSCNYATNYLGNMRRHFEVRHKGIPFDKASSFSYRVEGDVGGVPSAPGGYETSVVIMKGKRSPTGASISYETDRKRTKCSSITDNRANPRAAEYPSLSTPKIFSPKRENVSHIPSPKYDNTNQISSKRDATNHISSLAMLQQMVLQKY